MAENNDKESREDLTEEPSAHRIEEYRKKGMVAQSREVSALIVFSAAAAALFAMCPQMGDQLITFMREIFGTDLFQVVTKSDSEASVMLKTILVKAGKVIISMGFPVCIAGFVAGIISGVIQTGAVFSFDPLTPDASRLDPLQGLQKMFSSRHFIDGLRIILKAGFVFAIAYALLKAQILQSPTHFEGDPSYLLAMFGRSNQSIVMILTGILAVFAAADYGFQRFEYSKGLRMTKQEAKQEHKEREGDPQIRARIRSIQREMARKRMMQAVRKADVVVTNPTHIAVALVYDRMKMAAPRVVAKGADLVAQKMKEVAAQAGVPMVENVPLARTLFKTVKIGQSVPRALYQAVAEVLAHVYRLRRQSL